MKQIFFALCIALASCNSDVTIETPATEARAVFASLRNERAANCAVTNKAVTATYFNPDVSFSLRYDQFAVIEMNGKTELVNAAVFQLSPGVFVAEMRDGDFVRVNTVSGNTSAKIGGKSYNFQKQVTP